MCHTHYSAAHLFLAKNVDIIIWKRLIKYRNLLGQVAVF